MSVFANSNAIANEAAAHSDQISPYYFGLFTFVALGALLVVTMMLKVDN
ncbi:MAG: hypothetical protein PHN51_04440 [Candidatus Nanopelagicales bacterium]|jgi:hypothetical protein|nr:hypothetical protein [Candidatus Nanopelagicales bacterium]